MVKYLMMCKERMEGNDSEELSPYIGDLYVYSAVCPRFYNGGEI